MTTSATPEDLELDRLAAKAMQGMLASGCTVDIGGGHLFQQRAKTAYCIADAMLIARKEPT